MLPGIIKQVERKNNVNVSGRERLKMKTPSPRAMPFVMPNLLSLKTRKGRTQPVQQELYDRA